MQTAHVMGIGTLPCQSLMQTTVTKIEFCDKILLFLDKLQFLSGYVR